MPNSWQNDRDVLTSRETLITMLRALPGAFFFINDTEIIVYANASAQAITGATLEELRGTPFWRGAPQLVSSVLYHAMLQARQIQALTEVEYCSPVTQTWLHVYLSPTFGGLTLQFHEVRAPAQRQEIFPQGDLLYVDIKVNKLWRRTTPFCA
jgi:PAS domain S-box-containing protein